MGTRATQHFPRLAEEEQELGKAEQGRRMPRADEDERPPPPLVDQLAEDSDPN